MAERPNKENHHTNPSVRPNDTASTPTRTQAANPIHHQGEAAPGCEKSYRQLLENSVDGYFEVDLAGNFTYVNEAVCRFAGRPREEMLNLNYRSYLKPDEAQRIFDIYHEVYRTGKPSELTEFEVIRKDGSKVINQTVVAALHNEVGGQIGFCGVVRDLTDLKNAQNELKTKEEKYRNILTNLEEGYYEIDLKGNFTDFNNATCINLGREPDEIKGMNYRECVAPASEEKLARAFERIYETGQPVNLVECELVRKDGTRRLHQMSASLLRDPSGKAVGFFGISRDRTDEIAMEKALRDSEESYRRILEMAPDAICIVDNSTSQFIQVNDAFCEHLDLTPEETVGRTPIELDIYQNPEDDLRIQELLARDGRIDGLEIGYKSRSGRKIDDLVSARTIRFKGMECTLFVATVITPLKEAQTALQESEGSYRRVMELAPDAITISRISDGQYYEVNNSFCSNTGYSREEIIEHTSAELNLLVNETYRDHMEKELRSRGLINGMEIKARKKDGAILETLVSCRPMTFEGEPALLFVSADITELKKAQKKLRDSEEGYRTIIESVPISMAVIRKSDNRYVEANETFCRGSGCKREEYIGRTVRDINFYDDSSNLGRITKILAEHGRLDNLEIKFRARNGQVRESLVSITPIQYRGEACWLFSSVEITDMKKAQRELDQYRQNLEQMVADRTRELEAAQKELVKRERLSVLGQLMATVSHELRNPLGVIRSSNFYLQRKSKSADKKQMKHFRRIEEQVTLCDAIVADLLEYTRGRSVSVSRQRLDDWMPEVIEQMIESEEVRISLEMAHDLPALSHDREKMRRVMINVLDNAAQAVAARAKKAKKASYDYHPEILVKAYKEDDNAVVIRVLDNGIGMDGETCRRAFEPLFTTRARGTGIGLAIVKKIVEEHGGQATLQSRLEEGTEMKIIVPYRN